MDDAPPSPGPLTVLIVDDDMMMRASMNLMLSSQKITAIEAGDGAEAVKALTSRKDSIDVMLLDVNLRPMKAEQIFAEARRLKPGLPVVFISGDAAARIDHFGDTAGAKVLPKPFSRGQLVEAVRAAARSKGPG